MRPAQDKDDEFPDLAVIIKRSRRGEDSRNGDIHSIPMIATTAKESVVRENLGQISKAVQRAKSKRRILTKAYDNPLLRPFEEKSLRSNSALPIENPKSTSTMKLPRPKLHQKDGSKTNQHTDSTSNEEDTFADVSTGLSDFIVNDSSFLEEDSEGDSTGEEYQRPPPKSTRRLVRGRRPSLTTSRGTAESLQVDTSSQPASTVGFAPTSYVDKCSDKSFETQGKPNGDYDIKTGPKRFKMQKYGGRKSNDQIAGSSPNEQMNLSPFKAQSSGNTREDCPCTTTPSSPQKSRTRLASPKKPARIPAAPHEPNTDAFWNQGVINEWNDEFSPKKLFNSRAGRIAGEITHAKTTTSRKESRLKVEQQGIKAEKLFAQNRHGIAEEFLGELDLIVAAGKVSELAASSGGIKIIWSKKLSTTAGRANWKLEKVVSETLGMDGKPQKQTSHVHYASIELAEKVINDEERLLNVIAHEFCHLANFMISGIKNNPHGKEFKSWASKCSQLFGDRGIHVTTKHSYNIDYKYTWECDNCGTEFKRHSKSIDPLRHQCSVCKSKLVQTKPKPRTNMVTNSYQEFVKKNMKNIRDENPGSPQKQIMGLMGKMYQEHKATRLRDTDGRAELSNPKVDEGVARREAVVLDIEADSVARRLDFLDLTSP